MKNILPTTHFAQLIYAMGRPRVDRRGLSIFAPVVAEHNTDRMLECDGESCAEDIAIEISDNLLETAERGWKE